MVSTRNLLALAGTLILAGIVAFGFAGFFSTVDLRATYISVVASGILFVWGFGILLLVLNRLSLRNELMSPPPGMLDNSPTLRTK